MKHVIDVGDAEFAAEVLDGSMHRPVLVDFWAEWCGPCKQLTPILEKLAEEFDGAFVLAKVNTEAATQVAAAARIQSIPTVMLFVGGQPVDGFVGVQPEGAIRDLLRRHCPTAADRLTQAGDRLGSAGAGDAEATYREAIASDPKQGAARLGLARILVRKGEVDEARMHLEAMPGTAVETRAAERLLESLDVWGLPSGASWPPPEEGEVAEAIDARIAEAIGAFRAGEDERALRLLYEAVAEDRTYRDEAARRAMVALFGFVGENSAVTRSWQKRLANLLY